MLPAPERVLQQPRIGRAMGLMLFRFDFYSERMKGRYIDTTGVINRVLEEKKIQRGAQYVAIAREKVRPCLSSLFLARS